VKDLRPFCEIYFIWLTPNDQKRQESSHYKKPTLHKNMNEPVYETLIKTGMPFALSSVD